ncbi:MAG: ParB/RepB/Spo0J family partition protein [Cyanobacteria bacterium P01_A01_bin.17]
MRSEPTHVFFGSKKAQTTDQSVAEIPCAQIYVPTRQVRKYFNPAAEQELIQSIAEHGVLEPILVRPLSEERRQTLENAYQYELVFGERRFRANVKANRTAIPAAVRSLSDIEMLQIQLDENLKRQELSMLEKLEGVLDLLALENNKSRKEIESDIQSARNHKQRKGSLSADVVAQLEIYQATLKRHDAGTPNGFIRQLQRFRKMPADIYQAAFEGQIDPSKGIEISRISDDKQRKELLQWLIEENPTVNEIRQRLKLLKGEGGRPTPLAKKTQMLLTRARKIKTWHTLAPETEKELKFVLAKLESVLTKL